MLVVLALFSSVAAQTPPPGAITPQGGSDAMDVLLRSQRLALGRKFQRYPSSVTRTEEGEPHAGARSLSGAVIALNEQRSPATPTDAVQPNGANTSLAYPPLRGHVRAKGVKARALAAPGSNSSNSSQQQDEEQQEEEGGDLELFTILLFPITAILFGLGLSYVLDHFAPNVPYTPALLVVGFVISCTHHNVTFQRTQLANSIEAWQELDGELILYIFIPPLVFGEAMSLDWHVVKRSLGQCLMLAVPGVGLNTVLAAVFAYFVLPYGWQWSLCFAFGAVVSATDPVAVVALLNALGASPALGMLIGGESLLNDGTAMVVFEIFFPLYLGSSSGNLAGFIARLVLGSIAFGLCCGAVLLGGLWLFSNRHDHSNGVLQTSLTLVAAYSAFYAAEGVLGVSGVLTLVVMGLSCAFGFWPLIVNEEEMHGMWHSLEWLLNTVLFQMTGLIIGHKFITLSLDGYSFGWATVTYLAMLVVRAIVVTVFYPIFSRMGYGCSWQSAVVVWWGGLRGALGLALALVMESELTEHGESITGQMIVIHISVVALLTLLVNAPTTAYLLRCLGLLQTPAEKEFALADLHVSMQRVVLDEYNKMKRHVGVATMMPKDQFWRTWIIDHVSELHEAINQKSSFAVDETQREALDAAATMIQASVRRMVARTAHLQTQASALAIQTRVRTSVLKTGSQPVGGKAKWRKTSQLVAANTKMAGKVLHSRRVKEMRGTFLRMVKRMYNEMTLEGHLRGRETVAISLIHTVDVAADYCEDSEREWQTLLGELRVPPPLLRAANVYLVSKRFDPWIIRAPLTAMSRAVFDFYNERTRVAALILICYVNAHDKAIKELEHAFGSHHYSEECKEIVRQQNLCLIHAQHYLLDLSEVDAAVASLRGMKPPQRVQPRLHRMVTKDLSRGSTERLTVKSKNASHIASNQVVQSVYARQTAQCLLSNLEQHVRELKRCGSTDEKLTEELLETMQKDTERMDREEKNETGDPEHKARVLLQLEEINRKHQARSERKTLPGGP